MSCNLRKQTLDALRSEAEGVIAKARVNVEVYLHNPVGIGEHPDVLSAIQDQLDVIAEQQERIEVLNSFSDTHSWTSTKLQFTLATSKNVSRSKHSTLHIWRRELQVSDTIDMAVSIKLPRSDEQTQLAT